MLCLILLSLLDDRRREHMNRQTSLRKTDLLCFINISCSVPIYFYDPEKIEKLLDL